MAKKLITFIALILFVFQIPFTTFAQNKTLFERLGGRDGIEIIVKQTIANMAADKQINRKLARITVSDVVRDWTDIVCKLAGGDCKAPKMKNKIECTQEEWNFFDEDITKALKYLKIEAQEMIELHYLVNEDIQKKYFKLVK